MIRDKLHYENRIAALKAKGEMKNLRLIRKAERALRRLEN